MPDQIGDLHTFQRSLHKRTKRRNACFHPRVRDERYVCGQTGLQPGAFGRFWIHEEQGAEGSLGVE
jgi:hypothetical protein